jgi:hypothetical protein
MPKTKKPPAKKRTRAETAAIKEAMRAAAVPAIGPATQQDLPMWIVELPPYIRITLSAMSEDDAIAKYRERTGIRRVDLVPSVKRLDDVC